MTRSATTYVRRDRRPVWVLAVIVLMAFLALAGASSALAAGTDGASSGSTAPWIQSDQVDYAPGATVVLSGGNWAPGEAVHIRVNDDQGLTWSRDVDATADDGGMISDTFTLPDWFVATYSVAATGDSGTATS